MISLIRPKSSLSTFRSTRTISSTAFTFHNHPLYPAGFGRLPPCRICMRGHRRLLMARLHSIIFCDGKPASISFLAQSWKPHARPIQSFFDQAKVERIQALLIASLMLVNHHFTPTGPPQHNKQQPARHAFLASTSYSTRILSFRHCQLFRRFRITEWVKLHFFESQ